MKGKSGICAVSQKCCGCGTNKVPKRQKQKYCNGCLDLIGVCLVAERQRFEFWRIARANEAERWGIRCPFPNKLDEPPAKVGEAWIIFNAALQLLNISLSLTKAFPWGRNILVILPGCIWDELTYFDLVHERTIAFFEDSFPYESWTLDAHFVSESLYYDGDRS